MSFQISTERTIHWHEFASLMESAGWGSGYDEASFVRSSGAYPLVVHARDLDGKLIAYLSAFSDRTFSTMLGELVVHQSNRGCGIGRAMLCVVEKQYPDVPIYVKAMGDAVGFFQACGYRFPGKDMLVLFKKPGAAASSR